MKAWASLLAFAAAVLGFSAVAFAVGSPGMMGPQHRTRVPSFLGYYDGHKDTFLAPDTSSRAEAKQDRVNFSAKLGTALKTTDDMYLFSGRMAAGQLPVFDSEPGEKNYTPLWREEVVTWKASATPKLITSDTQVDRLEKQGVISVRETRTVLNCPIVKVGKRGGA